MSVSREFLYAPAGIVSLVLSILGTVFFVAGAILSVASLAASTAGAPVAAEAATGALGAVFLTAGGVFLTVGLVLGLRRRGVLRERDRLLAQGTPCEGTIVELEQDLNVRVNRKHPWRVTYRYQAGGASHEKRERMLDLPPGLEAGKRVTVVYDPADPKRSAIKRV